MSYKASETVAFQFTTTDAEGNAVAPDVAPSGIIVLNGEDGDGVSISVKSTGVYKGLFSVPSGATEGQNLECRIMATIDGVTTADVRSFGQITAKRASELNDFDAANDTVGQVNTVNNGVTLADGAITAAKIASGAVTAAKFASGAITSTVLANGAIGNGNIGTGAISDSKIATGAIQASAIADGALTTDKFADGFLTAAKFADGFLTAAKIAANAITAAKIATDAIGSAQLATTAVTEIWSTTARTLTSAANITSNGSAIVLNAADSKVLLAAATHTGAILGEVAQVNSLAAGALATIQLEVEQGLGATGVTSLRMGYLDKLNITGNVAASTEVTSIQNNTRCVRVVPASMERPDAGSVAYRLELMLYDDAGSMEAPDSTPTLTVVNQEGTDRAANLSAATNVATGHYRWTYTVASDHAMEQLIFSFSVIEGGNTRAYGNTTVVVDATAVNFTTDDRSKLAAIYGKLPTTSYLTGTGQSSGALDLSTAAGVLAAGAISAASFAADAITSDVLAASAVSEIQSVLVTHLTDIKGENFNAATDALDVSAAADVWANQTRTLTAGTRDDQIDAIKAKTDTIPVSWPTADSQATIITHLTDIKGGSFSAQTDALDVTAAADFWSSDTRTLTAGTRDAEIDALAAKVDTLHDSRLTATRAGYLDNLAILTGMQTKVNALHDDRLTQARANALDYLDASILSRQPSGNVTVGGYLAGQSPADLVLTTPSQTLATDAFGRVTVGSNADKNGYALSASGLNLVATTVPTGGPDNWPQMMNLVYHRFYGKVIMDAVEQQYEFYAANGSLLGTQALGETSIAQQQDAVAWQA